MTRITKDRVLAWAQAAIVRALRTFAQTMVATLPAGFALTEVNWAWALSIGLGAALLSVLMSLAGLPEVDDGKSLPVIASETGGDHAEGE